MRIKTTRLRISALVLLTLAACASPARPTAIPTATVTAIAAPATTTLAPASPTPTTVPTVTSTPTPAPTKPGAFTIDFSTHTPTATPTAPPMAAVVLTGTFEITPALVALYSSEGLMFTASGLAQFPADEPFLTSTVKVLVAAPFTENNFEKYALVIAQDGAWGDSDGYGYPVPIRAATFARRGNTWVAEWQGGTDGVGFNITEQTPPGELVRIGPDHHGFLFRNTLTSPGYASSSWALFGEANGLFAPLLTIPHYSESMENPSTVWANWKYDSTYQFVPGANPDYFDLRVTQSGTAVIDGQITRFSREMVFAYGNTHTIYGGSYQWQAVSTPPPTPTDVADRSFTVRQALETLYGQYPGAVVSDTNIVFIPEARTDFTITWVINIVLAAPYDEAGHHKMAILTEWSKDTREWEAGCHLCGADLGGGIFVKTDNTWVVETKNISNTVDNIGSWGHAPDGHLVQIGPNRYGFLFFPSTGGQGYSDDMLSLYAEVNGKLKRIFFFDGFKESYPAHPDEDWPILGHTSVYHFKPGKYPNYYDLLIDTTGHCDANEYLRPTCGLRIYTFNGSEYVQTSGPALLTPPSP